MPPTEDNHGGSGPSGAKLREWQLKAAEKDAVVPAFFEVFPQRVFIRCGKCGAEFRRNLVPNVNEPVFACPNEECLARNWVPLRYRRRL